MAATARRNWNWDRALRAWMRRAGGSLRAVTRLELARRFHLSRAEALLLDIHAADQGDCLLIDIGASHGRGKRRLVLLGTAQERQVLDRVLRLFEHVDCGVAGPEGKYRQRLYRLKCYLTQLEPPPQREVLAA